MLSDQDIIRIRGIHSDIEVFFKATKFMLKLKKGGQGLSYDSLISRTPIVFAKHVVLSWPTPV